MMALTEMVRKGADYMLSPYLDSPAPPSLEMLSVQGERESVTIEDKTCFVYQLLTASGKRYEREGSFSVEIRKIPCLPRLARNLEPTLKNRLRKVIRPEVDQRDFASIEQALQKALRESQIVEYREGVYGILGTTEKELRQLLYLPAETALQADEKLNLYRAKVTDILQPNRLECFLKIKPLVKPGKIVSIPRSLKESYFGHGC